MRTLLYGSVLGALFVYVVDDTDLLFNVVLLLRHRIWPATSWEAMVSPWIYGREADGLWWTSPLGVINGVLRMFGLKLVAHYTADPIEPTPIRPYLSLEIARGIVFGEPIAVPRS